MCSAFMHANHYGAAGQLYQRQSAVCSLADDVSSPVSYICLFYWAAICTWTTYMYVCIAELKTMVVCSQCAYPKWCHNLTSCTFGTAYIISAVMYLITRPVQKLKTQIYCSAGSFCPVKLFQHIQYFNVATIFVATVSLGPNGVHAVQCACSSAVQLLKGDGGSRPGMGKAHAHCVATIYLKLWIVTHMISLAFSLPAVSLMWWCSPTMSPVLLRCSLLCIWSFSTSSSAILWVYIC